MPAFVVGCGRSGTSMLLHHLGRSRAVDPFNENDAAAFEKFRLRPLDEIEKLVQRSYAQVALFKPVLCTPHSCEYLNRFPDARLIFVYRRYGDVVNSSVKKFGPADRVAHIDSWVADDFSEFAPIAPPPETRAVVRELWKPSLSPESAAALYWLFYNRLYFDLGLDQEPRAKLIGYESMVASPEAHIKDACDFLGLKFEPVMIDGIFATSVGRDNPPPMDEEIASACEALWQRFQAAAKTGSAGN
jgi:hypothetical protein